MNKPSALQAPSMAAKDLAGILGEAGDTGGRRWLRRGLYGLIALAVAGGIAWYLNARQDAAAVPRYETVAAEKGNIVVTVTATGTLQPINKVDVGSELSGTIQRVLVDDNSVVKKGQELARLDTSKLEDQIARSRASLASADAGVLQARATVDETRANLQRQQEVFRISAGKVPSKAELDTAEATLARALANQSGAEAAVKQTRAQLKTDETNLSKATVRSPIDGVVLTRKVDPGQTVAASLQAPVLFSMAQDLTEMKLQVNVDEADVGKVKDEQTAMFTVDAWPGRKYPATITRVGYGSQTTDGVVTYLTVLKVNNDDLSLRPGMTATAEITTEKRENVLLVPNAALRFNPPASGGKKRNGSLVDSFIPKPPTSGPPKTSRAVKGKSAEKRLWVLRDGQALAVDVTTGSSNGKMTEITGGELEAGAQVIVDMSVPKK